MDPNYKAPAPRDASLSRAERRRLERGRSEVVGTVGCKFCMSTRGVYERAGNRFYCYTPKCKGGRK